MTFRHANSRRQSGFSFIELIMSILLLGLAVGGILLAYSQTVSRSADPMLRMQSVTVAESYMEEILGRRFSDPDGIDGEGSRAAFDDVDDYDGLSQEPQAADGTTLGLSDYTVTVSVSPASLGSIASGSGAVLRIDVTVTHVSGESTTLTGYRTDYGP